MKKAFGQKSEWEFCPEAFLLHSRRQLYVLPVFPCFQALATGGCADVQSVLWHATAAPAIVKPADNRKEMFFKVSEPVHPGQHRPSAACGVKKWLPYFSFLFLSERPLPCVILAYERGGRICGRNPSDRRYPGACGRCVLWRGIWSLPDNVKLLRKEYLQLAEHYPFSEGMHRKMSEKQTL